MPSFLQRAAPPTASTPIADTNPRWRVAGFLAVAAALNYADRTAISAVLAPIQSELGLSDVALGLVISLFLWSYAIASPFSGMLADRFSRTAIVIISLISWSVVTGLTGLASGLVALCTLRLALGACESLYHPSAFALVADHHGPSTRGRAMSLLSIGFQSGVIFGGTAAGFLAEHYGWRAGFAVLGIVGVGLALAARCFVVDGPAVLRPAARPDMLAALRYLIRVPSFQVLLAKSMLIGIGTFVFMSWLPLYIYESFHLNLGAAGFAGTFMLQASKVVGVAGGGWVSDLIGARNGRRRLLFLAVCYLAAAPFLLIFLVHPSFLAVAAAVAAFSLFGGMGMANEQPALCEVVPAQFRSTAIGISNTFATAAGGLGVLAGGFLKAQVGLATVFASVFLVYCLAAGIVLVGYRFFMLRDSALARSLETK